MRSRHAARYRIVRGAGAALLAGVVVLAGCASGGDDDEAVDTSTSTATAEPTVTDALFTPADDAATVATAVDGDEDGASTAPDTEADDASETTVDEGADDAADGATTTLAVVPDTGVPGIDSTNVFCRAWAQFGGTFQGLAIAWGVGDADLAAHNEVAASSAVLSAVADLDANVPTEIEHERADLAALVEPMSRRAAAARDELVAAGVADVGILDLGDAWLVALADAGIDEPAIVIAVPDTVEEVALSAASAAFAAARPPLIDDPSMITDVAIPDTEQYLIDNCPDQGTLLGNDDVDVAP